MKINVHLDMPGIVGISNIFTQYFTTQEHITPFMDETFVA